MKRCLKCDRHYEAAEFMCPGCGTAPATENGFISFAPEKARESEGFKEGFFGDITRYEEKHFWFKARNKLIVELIGKSRPGIESFHELGCGTGFVLKAIAASFPGAAVTGSEIFTAGLEFAQKRVPGAALMQLDALDMPFFEEFDVIGAFDVLEHIKDDAAVVSQAWKALKPGGVLVATVPQHRWLWSRVDEYACHVRRYRSVELSARLEDAGFEVERSTSFVTLLMPLLLASRLLQADRGGAQFDPVAELKLNPLVNGVFGFLMGIEIFLIRLGVDLPLGGSRIVVARKPA